MDAASRTGIVLTIRTVASTGSTNADLLALGDAAAEGNWLRAERQTEGRGRQGRRWQDDGGNLAISTVVRLRDDDPPAPTLALVAAVALHDVVASFLPGRAVLKWPNDVMVGSAKLSGILLERSGAVIVIGFGVNVAGLPKIADRKVTSLSMLGCDTTPAALAVLLEERFAVWLACWRRSAVSVHEAWVARAHPVGTALNVRIGDGTTHSGSFGGLARDGALLLRDPSGAVLNIHAGEVFAC